MSQSPEISPEIEEPVALFGHWICPFSVRVEFALVQLGIKYEVVDVPPTAVRPKDFVIPAEFVVNSPRAEIPMIREGGRYLADSIPILERLYSAVGVLSGAALEEAHWVDQNIFPPMIAIYYGVNPESIRRASDRLVNALTELEAKLVSTGWLVGDGASIAEAALIPFYVRLEGLRSLGFEGELPRLVQDHAARCLALPGGEAVRWSEEQQSEFSGRFHKYRDLKNDAD
ncbi:MAG: glutathione S-transferase family protein [Actinomycetes bacterium]